MFNFQHSQTAELEFEQLTELQLKYPMVQAASNLIVGNKFAPTSTSKT